MTTRRWGSETLVNTTTAGNQADTRVTPIFGGRYIVTWRDEGVGALRGQAFNPDGSPSGDEMVLLPATGALLDYSGADTKSGGFAIAWTQANGPVNDIHIQKFGASLAPTESPLVIPGTSAVTQVELDAFGTSSSTFLVSWQTPTGSPEAKVVTRTDAGLTAGATARLGGRAGGLFPGGLLDPDLAAAPGQALGVAAWRVPATGAIEAQPLGANGAVLAFPTEVRPAGGAGVPRDPSVTWIAARQFVVAWTETALPDPTNPSDIRLRVMSVDAGGGILPVTGILAVNAVTSGVQQQPQVVGLPSGGFVVAWLDFSGIPNPGVVRLQAFDASGGRLGGEALVSGISETMTSFSLAALEDGRVAVSWIAQGESDTDGDGSAVHLQIIDPRDGTVTGTAFSDQLYGHDQVNDEISGYGGNDDLFGLGGDDALWGGAGNDVLDGGTGADAMHGGSGNDTYVLDHPRDAGFELAGQGTDTVQSDAISLTLAANVENAVLLGGLALSATGNAGNNMLDGVQNSAANVLAGLGGNDSYVLGIGDTLVEPPGAGTDTVASAAFSLDLALFPTWRTRPCWAACR